LVSAHPELQEAVALPEGPRKLEVGYYNLGIAFVVPSLKLVEILQSKELIEMRDRKEPKPPRPVPVGTKTEAGDISKTKFVKALKRVSRQRIKPKPASESGP
jgi:hypothetical protein